MIEGGRQEPTDLLIFAVKGLLCGNPPDWRKSLSAEDTVILSLLNGISSEEILAEFFGEQHLIYTVAQGMDATKIGNRLKFSNMGNFASACQMQIRRKKKICRESWNFLIGCLCRTPKKRTSRKECGASGC